MVNEQASLVSARRSRVRPLVSAALLVVVGLVSGIWAVWPNVARPRSEAVPSSQDADAALQQASRMKALPSPAARPLKRVIRRPFLMRPIAADSDAASEQRYREQQAKDLLNLLRASVAEAETFNPVPGNPEGAANLTTLYVKGWLDAVVRTAPDLVDELAAEVQQSMCSPQTSGAELIVVSRVLLSLPELADPTAFECLFSRHTDEDAVLWSALEAWRRSGLPKSERIAEIERRATDARTRFQLLSPEEQLKEQMAARSMRDLIPLEPSRHGPVQAPVTK